MSIFYGVYLEQTAISSVLDVIRFLGEPDSIRFAHITLRGPYVSGLNKRVLSRLNDACSEHTVRLVKPATFFTDTQSTTVIEVDLLSLRDLLHKPDFPDGTPHLTIYDGKDRHFARDLYNLIIQYDWGNYMQVGPLRPIVSKRRLCQEFLPFFTGFNAYFKALVGDPRDIETVQSIPPPRRLAMIESILERCTAGARKTALQEGRVLATVG